MRATAWLTGFFLLANVDAIAQTVRARGLNFLDQSAYQSIPLAVPILRGQLPQRVDLSGSFPAPGDQGDQGSCVGWATSYLKTYQEKRERDWSLASKAHQFSPAFIFNQIKLSSCQEGAYFVDALNLLRQKAAATLDVYPYTPTNCSVMPTALTLQSARQYTIADWRRVNVQDPLEVKGQLAAGFPVLIGAIVGPTFSGLIGAAPYKGDVSNTGGHAMVVVGYDDAKGSYRVINSYGTKWGDNGYFWLDYGAFPKVVVEAYVAQDVILDRTVAVDNQQPTTPVPQVQTPAVVADSSMVKLGLPRKGINTDEMKLWLSDRAALWQNLTNGFSATFDTSLGDIGVKGVVFFDQNYLAYHAYLEKDFRATNTYGPNGTVGSQKDLTKVKSACEEHVRNLLPRLSTAFGVAKSPFKIERLQVDRPWEIVGGGAAFCGKGNAVCHAEAVTERTSAIFNSSAGDILFSADSIIGASSVDPGYGNRQYRSEAASCSLRISGPL